MNTISKTERQRIAGYLVGLAFDDVPRSERPRRDDVAKAMAEALDNVSDDEQKLLESAVPVGAPSLTAAMKRAILKTVADPVIERARRATQVDNRRDDITTPPLNIMKAAARIAVAPETASANDIDAIDAWVAKKGAHDVITMDDFVIEDRGLPEGFDADTQKAFLDAVGKELTRFGGNVRASFVAVVAGRLILDGNTTPERADFKWGVKRAYDVGVSETDGIANKDHYEGITDDLLALRPRQKIRVQELAAIADYVIAAGDDWSINDERDRREQVHVGQLKYADGSASTGFAPLCCRRSSARTRSNQEIEPQNVKAVAMIAAAAEIEQTGAFDAVDRMVELFMEGMLPVRDDAGGRALDNYYWRSEDRLDASSWAAQYSRVLGIGHGAGSDVQPNAAFDQQLMRFVASLVRYDGDLQVSNIVTASRGDRPSTSEKVRKSAQDFAANASCTAGLLDLRCPPSQQAHRPRVRRAVPGDAATLLRGHWTVAADRACVGHRVRDHAAGRSTPRQGQGDQGSARLARRLRGRSVGLGGRHSLPSRRERHGQRHEYGGRQPRRLRADGFGGEQHPRRGRQSDEDIASIARPTAGVPRA